MEFKELYKNIDEKYKNQFLYNLLEKDNALKNQFLNQAPVLQINDAGRILNYKDFVEEIIEKYNDFLADLKSINIEEMDWENYVPPHSGYIEEWEAYEIMAENEIDSVFDYFSDDITDFLLQGSISGVMTHLLAFLKASIDYTIYDPFDILGDSTDYLINGYLKEWINFANNKISNSKLNDAEIINTLQLFLKYFKEHIELEHLLMFDDVLSNLIVNKIQHKDLLPKYNEFTLIEKKRIPFFAFSLTKYTDKTNLENVALELMLFNISIAKYILQKYLQENQKDKYLKVAKKLFYNDKSYWTKEIVKHVDLQDEKDFFVEINLRYCIDNRDVEYYKKVKHLLNNTEKSQIIDSLYDSNPLKAEILKEEGKYTDIKEIIKKQVGSWGFSIEVLDTIKDVDTDFVMNLIRQHIQTLIKSEKKGRAIYKIIASFLIYAKTLQGQQHKVDSLILSLYNHKPALPALKDEFRKAGLIKK